MNYETAISEVQQIIGWRADKSTEIGSALRYAQSEREKPNRTYPWWLKQTKTITTVIGTHSYTIPTGYIQDTEEREGNLFIYSDGTSKSRTVFLKKRMFKEMQEKYFGVWPAWPQDSSELADSSDELSPGTPAEYALDSTTVFLYPVPDAVYTINWKCWAADTTLSAGVENGWLLNAPWLLIGDAAAKIASDLGYAQGVATANGLIAKAEDNLFRAVIHRQEASRKRGMGSRL